MHLLLGYSVDHINKFILNLSLKGTAKLKPYCVKQAEALTPEILQQVVGCLDLKNVSDIVYCCLFLFAFFLLARKSNLVPSSKKDILQKRFLLRKNVEDHGSFLVVNMKWTKTIQKGERVLQIPLTQAKDSHLCPVRIFRKMCKLIPAYNDAPLFLLPNNKVITYSMFQSKFRYCIHKIGLSAEKFSTHSFRRGGATLLFRAKVPADKIQFMGDWRSDAYKKYLAFSLEDKIQISEVMNKYF